MTNAQKLRKCKENCNCVSLMDEKQERAFTRITFNSQDDYYGMYQRHGRCVAIYVK